MESAPTVQGSMLLIDPESCSLYRQGPVHCPLPARTASTRFPYTCGPHMCGPYMRDAGEGAAARRVPGAVKTAPYMAPVNGES